jgi:hypothetical protein
VLSQPRMKRRCSFAFSALLALACDPGPSDPPDGAAVVPDDPETYEDFARALAQAQCDAYEECWGGEFDCASDVPADAPTPAADGTFPGGRRRYDGTRGGECLGAIAADPCAVTAIVNSGCEGALTGVVPVGGECIEPLDCAAGSYCRNTGACPQLCTAYAAQGESCAEIACAPALSCATGGEGNRTCVVPSAEGAECHFTQPCAAGTYCVVPTGSDAGTCLGYDDAATTVEGEPCPSHLCTGDLSCVLRRDDHPESGPVCFATAAPGGPCYFAVPSMCPEGQWCDRDGVTSIGAMGTCRAFIGTDEPCPGFEGCDPSLLCVSEVCRDLTEIGGACTGDLECESFYCAAGACATRPICPPT